VPKDILVKTTSLSTKGQLVIPEAIRKELNLEAGDQFVVYGHGDTLMFKMISRPNKSQIKAMFARTQAAARRAGAKRSDITKAIKTARGRV
jgi:AbrB family looped-hinge helix DNA binding protein